MRTHNDPRHKTPFPPLPGVVLTLRPTVVVDGSRGEEGHQGDSTRSSSDFVVNRSEFLVTRTEPAENGGVGGFPEGLGVGKERIDARHQRCTPQINRRPPVRQKFRRGSERQRRGMEEVSQVEDEETGVRGELA